MEELGSSRFEGIGNTVRRRRTNTSRRPRPESQPVSDGRDISSLSSTPPSDDMRAGSSDENSGGDHSSRRKELSLSQCASRFPTASGLDGEKPIKKSKKVDIGLDELYGNSGFRDSGVQGRTGLNHRRSSEGVLAPANWKSTSSEPRKTMALNNRKGDESSGPSLDGLGNENKVKKVKLKVGGVTRTIDTNSSLKTSCGSDATVQQQKLIHKDNSDNDSSPQTDKRGGLQGIPWKDFSRGGFNLGREESSMGKGNGKNNPGKQGDKTDSVRKSKRAPKKRVIDGFDDDDGDDEIRYLEKLKNAKFSTGYDDEESSRKHRRLSKFSGNVPETLEGSTSSRVGNDGKKKSPSEDTDYEEDEEPASDGEPEGRRKKKARKGSVESPVEPKRELTLTTRQRALQSGRDTSSPGSGVEFPNGLPPAPSRKQKEKLSEVEQQLKKAEAAQRRRMQNEKAARESEAEAIRKILGQDSNRKKREDKKKRRVEELAQEKAADELMRASNSIRLVMGPNGTTVTFPNEMGLPSIFESKPYRYPPPREICAGPSCENPYKYRDSKTKLPLCSLRCYKAVQQNVQSEAATC